MTEIEKGWLAGLIDGEGSIMLFRKKRFDVKRNSISYVTAQLSITNSHKETLLKASALIEEITGKVPRWIDDVHGKFTQKQVMRLCIDIYGHINLILKFLDGCLITKKEQAKIALEFCEKATKRHKTNQREREMYWRKMKFLNGKFNTRPQRLNEETPLKTDEAIVRASGQPEEVIRNIDPTTEYIKNYSNQHLETLASVT